MIVFSSLNHCNDIIIAMSKCVYKFELDYQVSDVAYGPHVFSGEMGLL